MISCVTLFFRVLVGALLELVSLASALKIGFKASNLVLKPQIGALLELL